MPTQLVVLDRDGVINQDSDGFIRSSAEWHAIDGSLEAIALLGAHGFTVAVATNQSGLARGLFDLPALNQIHGTLVDAVEAAGGHIDRIVFCPHGPDEGCDCRKPAPGLLRQLAEHYGVSLDDVPFIGDSLSDLEAARSVGARGLLVRSGKGRATEKAFGDSASGFEVFDDLLHAARCLVSEKGR
jgi:D-glycero-D-manno-heptose 1,7-bisphosphate phosphatase